MQKITTENKLSHQHRINELKEESVSLRSKSAALESEIRKNADNLNNYRHLAIAYYFLIISDINCEMFKATNELLHTKPESYLNEARKNYSHALLEAEKVVGNVIDNPLNENLLALATIPKFNSARVLELVRKFEKTLEKIEECGKGSKYDLNFIDMEGRYVAILKNIIDFRQLSTMDPRDPYYPQKYTLLNMVREKLRKTADRHREKYMVKTKKPEDIKKAIRFQEVVKMIATLFNYPEEVEHCKKSIETWKTILDKDLKEQDERKRREVTRKK